MEPVNKLSLPSNTKAEPDICTLLIKLNVSDVFPLTSMYCIKKAKLSGLYVFGFIGTLNLNSSGEKPVLEAGLNDKSLIIHSPE